MGTQTPNEPRQFFYLKSLDNFCPINNYVLIKPIIKNIYRRTEAGLSIVAPEYKDQPNHVDRIGIVIKLPINLVFNESKTSKSENIRKMLFSKKTNKYEPVRYTIERKVYRNEQGSLQWDTHNELKEGDIVLYNYLESINSTLLLIDNEKYYLIKYDEIIARKRNNKIQPINGYIICKKVKKERESQQDYLYNNKIDDRFLIAEYIGKPVRKYFGSSYENDEGIKKGDKLLKDDKQLKPTTEYLYHSEFFNSKEEFVFLQRRYFIAILN
jgi:co-chaperonin GroES (HSP10)